MDYSYLVSLAETDPSQWINALRVGSFKHPVYGDLDITPERLQRFAASVTEKVRGIDPDIDYDHKAKDGKAAGWVKEAEVRDDSLYIKVEWTDPAKEALSRKEYRYFSPEFADEWEDAKGTTHKDVLFGGALTNRPFLKDLQPLNFDDYFIPKTSVRPSDKGVHMETKVLSEALGIKETDEGKLIEAVKKLSEDAKANVELQEELKTLREFKEAQEHDANQEKKFAEMFPEIAKEKEATHRRLAELEKTNKLAETDARISEWQSKGLPPVLDEVGLREFRSDLSADAAAKFDEIMAKTVEVGLVKLGGEQGGSKDPSEQNAIDQFEGKIKELMEKAPTDKPLAYFDAVKLAEVAEPELAKAYAAANR